MSSQYRRLFETCLDRAGIKYGAQVQGMGTCPFHANGKEKTPSFSFNLDDCAYYCHGCEKGGGATGFADELGISHEEQQKLLPKISKDDRQSLADIRKKDDDAAKAYSAKCKKENRIFDYVRNLKMRGDRTLNYLTTRIGANAAAEAMKSAPLFEHADGMVAITHTLDAWITEFRENKRAYGGGYQVRYLDKDGTAIKRLAPGSGREIPRKSMGTGEKDNPLVFALLVGAMPKHNSDIKITLAEGVEDALAIAFIGKIEGIVVALVGGQKALPVSLAIANNKWAGFLAIAMDGDEAGRRIADEVKYELAQAAPKDEDGNLLIKCKVITPPYQYDPNSWLMQDEAMAVSAYRFAFILGHAPAAVFQAGIIPKPPDSLLLPFSFFAGYGDGLREIAVGLPIGLTLLVARTSSGKTSLSATLAANIARKDSAKPVIFITVEEARFSIVARVIAAGYQPKIDSTTHWTTKQGLNYMRGDGLPTLDDGTQKDMPFVPSNMRVWEAQSATANDIMAALEAIPPSDTPSAVFIDYLQIINAGSKGERRDIEISKVAHNLKNWAQRRGCALVISAQAGRESIGHPKELREITGDSIENAKNALRKYAGIQLHQIREGGSEQPADMVLAIQLWRMDCPIDQQEKISTLGMEDMAELRVLKDRMGDGHGAMADMTLRGAFSQFVDGATDIKKDKAKAPESLESRLARDDTTLIDEGFA